MNTFSINFNGFFQNIANYFLEIYQNPFRLIIFVLDVLIVLYIIYKFLSSARHSRVWQILKGIMLIILIMILSDLLQFRILNYILTVFMPYGMIALIVIFQPEMRRMLEQLGTNKFTKIFGFGMEKDLITRTKEDIYKIAIAAKEMSNARIGGLIVIERDIQLADIMDSGLKVGADISPQLLVNIFVPKTPLHDGAVIISNNKIEAAACILPLADDKAISKGLGTRHRAAIGISRETDAIAVVISEETGKISIAKDGNLIVDLKEEALKNILIKNVITKRFGEEENKKTYKFPKFKKRRKQEKIEEKQELDKLDNK